MENDERLVVIHITLDLLPFLNNVKVKASQYDNGTRLVIIHVTRDGESFDMSGMESVRVEGTRTDGVGFVSVCTVSGAYASFFITKEMTNRPGRHPAELVLIGTGEDRIGTMNFTIDVEQAPLDENAVVTQEDATILQQYIDTMGEATVHNVDGGTFTDWSEEVDNDGNTD